MKITEKDLSQNILSISKVRNNFIDDKYTLQNAIGFHPFTENFNLQPAEPKITIVDTLDKMSFCYKNQTY